mgnify:CR=1 FL=1
MTVANGDAGTPGISTRAQAAQGRSIAEILKDGFLAQNAYDAKDTFCSPERQVALLRLMLTLHRKGQKLIEAGLVVAAGSAACAAGAALVVR